MKVELDEKGTLVIRAESAVESFALTHWYRMWDHREATFLVQTVERADDKINLDTHMQPLERQD